MTDKSDRLEGNDPIAMIKEDMSLVDIEFAIRQRLKECSYWGELPISKKQYEYLCSALSEKREGKTTNEFIDFLFEGYSASTVTTMVFYAVFEYVDEFWGPWNARIGIEQVPQNLSSLEGRKMIQTLKKFHMDKFEDDGYKYLTPILCQAGVPDHNLDDIFYAITTSNRFDAHELIAEFKGWRATYIKKSLERFIRLHEDSALNLVVLVHDVMLDGEIADEETYEGRIYGKYDEWKEANLNRKGSFKGKGAYQENPHLVLDEDKGLCMVLPEYILTDEYCDYIKWVIGADEEDLFGLECEVFNDGNSKHSLKKAVPLPAKKKYAVRIYDPEPIDGDKLLDDWEVKGLQDKGYLLFSENGKKRTDDMFPPEGATIIISDELTDISFTDIFEDEVILPNSDGIKTYHILPEKSTAKIKLGNEDGTEISLKRSISVRLSEGDFLFGSDESGYYYPIYTGEPLVRIEKEDGKIDTSISMVLRNRDSGSKKTVSIDQVDTLSEDPDSVTFPALQSFGVAGQYGRYSIKFYVKGLYKKEIEFAFIPEFVYDDKPQVLWPNEKGTFLASGFRYKIPKGASIEFTSKVNEKTEKDGDEYWHVVKSREPNEFIEGEITVNKDDERKLVIPFRKRVRNLQWMLWKEDEVDTELSYGEGRLDAKEMRDENWLMSFSMKKPKDEETCFIILESSEGEEVQQVKVKPSEKGKWHISLKVFQASMEDKKLPLTVSFKVVSEDEIHQFKLVEIYESIILRGLRATRFKKKIDEDTIVPVPVLVWNPTPKGYNMQSLVIKSLTDLEMDDIPIENVRRKKTKEDKIIHFMSFEQELPTGLYKVAYGEEDYFDFGYDEFEPPVLTYDNTFVVGKKTLISNFNEGYLAGVLDAISAEYRNEEMLSEIEAVACQKIFTGSLDLNDLRRMIVFAIYSLKEPNGRCEKFILSLLKIVYEHLDEQTKAEFFKTIMDVEIKETEKKRLIDFFGLYYVVTKEATQETIDKIMSIDTFLGTRSVLKCPRSQWVLHSLTSSLGFDIMKEMTAKLPDGSLKVEATYDMFGDTNYFYNMFNWESVMKTKNYKPPKLDLSKKPEEELVFWSDGFINLMIKWYFKGQGKHKDLENETVAIAKDIDRMATAVGRIAGDDVQDYLNKTIAREPQNNGGFYPLIAYSVKAGMIFALHDFGRVKLTDDKLDLLNKFINNMTVIFPELIKRDILMAELYLYLKEV